MRIISGEYGGRVLKSPPDNKTRPTSDRLRETLFNVLAPLIDEDTRFLDLCAGTGAIGIEALSRGAGFATFVDRSRRACALIEENLDKLAVAESRTDIQALTAENFVGREHKTPWSIIFFDPPYDSNYDLVIHDIAFKRDVLAADGVLVVEHHSKTKMPDAVAELRRWRLLKQGESSLSFYEYE